MELRRYWRILRRRLWLVLSLLIIVLAGYLLLYHEPPPNYAAHMRFVVGLEPETGAGVYYTYDRYYTWLTAEYLVDDLAEVVKSRAFAQDVARRAGLGDSGGDALIGAIQGSTSAGKLHRILTISLTWPNANELESLANAVVAALGEGGATYFAQLSTESAKVSLIDPPTVAPVGRSLRQRLDLPLRLAIALIAGVGLAFLLDYFDDTIRSRQDVAALGLDTLAAIPAERRALLHAVIGRRSHRPR
ncbi:MAG: hypothetical protein H5T69_04065 [Chloroflexi bacterium]|nr:hypothetical protein [Chloroflexota bacterium]